MTASEKKERNEREEKIQRMKQRAVLASGKQEVSLVLKIGRAHV